VQDVEPIEEIKTADDIPIESEGLSVDAKRADELITDSLAKNLVRKRSEGVYTDGSSKSIINVDTLSENFSSGDKIDVNVLKSKSLVPYDTAYIKVLARGMIDKPLTVYANGFSLSAVKMIALTGGEAIKTVTLKPRDKNDTDS
jgi:ribosomal protein L15